MNAARITQYGDADAVTVTADTPRPARGDGMILVEIHAASLNPADTAIRAGYMHQMAPLSFPATLGIDFAGVVVETAGTGPAVGEKVFGTASALAGGSGAFADFASVRAGSVARMPAGVSFEDAAALPLAGVSALQALQTLEVRKGSTLFIQGGAGGIGSFAIQIAKHLGARVVASCRASSRAFVKSLGADLVIDFEQPDALKGLREFDAVLDTAGGAAYQAAFAVLKKGGTILTIATRPDAELAAKHGVTALSQMTDVNTARLERLAALVSAGSVKVHIERTFPLGEIRDAFRAREAGHVKGKIVLRIKG